MIHKKSIKTFFVNNCSEFLSIFNQKFVFVCSWQMIDANEGDIRLLLVFVVIETPPEVSYLPLAHKKKNSVELSPS